MPNSTSVRECKYCKEPGLSINSKVLVAPHYKHRVRKETSPISFSDVYILEITERFICPNCGETVINEYSVNLTQQDMQYIVDNIIERRRD